MTRCILPAILIASSLLFSCGGKAPLDNDYLWTNLLDTGFSQFEKFIGVPHYSITTLPDHPKGDGMNGTPLGLNNDPLGVFTIVFEEDVPVLKVSGEIYGGLTTLAEYGDFHFVTEFKWGEKKYEPRLEAKRDNGILYHAYGPHGAFWNVWMNSQEFQVQEGDMGDYFALGPAGDVHAVDSFADGEQGWIFSPLAPQQPFGDGGVSGRCRRGRNAERPHSSWNTLELICFQGKSLHLVNGEVVMVVEHSRVRAGGNFEKLDRGKIQIQSEGAEAYYRNMRIRPITAWPEAYTQY